MISRSDDYVEYCRETAKRARDLHDLALRGRDKKELTFGGVISIVVGPGVYGLRKKTTPQ